MANTAVVAPRNENMFLHVQGNTLVVNLYDATEKDEKATVILDRETAQHLISLLQGAMR